MTDPHFEENTKNNIGEAIMQKIISKDVSDEEFAKILEMNIKTF